MPNDEYDRGVLAGMFDLLTQALEKFENICHRYGYEFDRVDWEYRKVK